MAGLDSIKHYKEAGSVESDTTEDTTVPVKTTMNIPGMGKVPLETAIGGSDVLKNLQDEYDRRTGGVLNPLMEGISDAIAMTSMHPGAMAARDQERRLREESLFGMKNTIAAIKQAQAQAAGDAALLGLTPGGTRPGVAGGAGSQVVGGGGIMDDIKSLPPNLQLSAMLMIKNHDYTGVRKLIESVELKKPDELKILDAVRTGKLSPQEANALVRQKFPNVFTPGQRVTPTGEVQQYNPWEVPAGGVVAPNAAPVVTAPANAPTSPISAGGVTWNSLPEEQKQKVLNAMWKMEGFGASPTNIPTSHNNPGDIVYGPFAKKFGATPGKTVTDNEGVTRTFAQFISPEDGKKAHRALWDEVYGNQSLDDALTKLRGQKTPSDKYRKFIYDNSGINYGAGTPTAAPVTTAPVTAAPVTTAPVTTGGDKIGTMGATTVTGVEARKKDYETNQELFKKEVATPIVSELSKTETKLGVINRALDALNDAKVGPGEQLKQSLTEFKGVFKDLSDKEIKDLIAKKTVTQNVQKLVGSNLKAMYGGQPSEREGANFAKTLANISDPREFIKATLEIAKVDAMYNKEAADVILNNPSNTATAYLNWAKQGRYEKLISEYAPTVASQFGKTPAGGGTQSPTSLDYSVILKKPKGTK